MSSVLLHRKQDFSHFCFIPCFINSCMEEVQVGVIYNTLLDSNEGDLSPNASQTIYFSDINENKISDRETPVELLSLELQYGTEPLLISSITIIRHSEASSCCSPLWNLSYSTSRNLSASTSVEVDALHAISNRNFDMEPSVLELNWKFWLIVLRIFNFVQWHLALK